MSARGIYIFVFNCQVWVACTTAGIQIIVVLLAFRVLFSTKPECSAKHFLAVEFSYCWLYPGKQAVDYFMLLRALTVFCFLTWNAQSRMFWQWLSLPVLLVYWSREVWIIPLTPGQSQVINLIVHDRVRWAGYRLNKLINSMTQYRYSPVF